MKSTFLRFAFLAAAAYVTLPPASCSRRPALPAFTQADSLAIIADNKQHRAEMDSFFRTDPHSPFVRDTTVVYHGINWFPIDAAFRGRSVLHTYADPETVIVMGTRGEARRNLRYGWFEFPVPNDKGLPVILHLNAYKFTPYDRDRYVHYPENLSVWFTDRTTGDETYGVGRYVDVGDDVHDPAHVYTVDLNKAYNPYCAYSGMYSCAIPRKEDRLDVALRVGEKKYHD